MKKYIGIVALALLAVGCNENDNNAFDPNEIRVEAAHPATNRPHGGLRLEFTLDK